MDKRHASPSIPLFAGLGLFATALFSPVLLAENPAEAAKPVSYFKQIRPIFQAACQGCHQPAKAQGDYIMTDFASLLKGGEDGTAIVPGKAEESHLLTLLIPNDKGEVEMPKKRDPLHETQVGLIRQWITEGAVDDTPAGVYAAYSATNLPRYTRQPVIGALDWSPKGDVIALSGFHEVFLRKPDGTLAGRLVGLSERVESVAFSPDGAKLAVTGGNPGRMGEVQIWDVAKQELEVSVQVGFDTIYGAAWSPDGTKVSFACPDNSVRAIEATTGKEVLFQGSHNDWPLDTVWSVTGSHVVSVSRDMSVKLTEIETQRFVDNITSITPGALRGGVNAVARHPQRDEVLIGGADGIPQIYRMNRLTKRVIGDNANLIRRFPAMEGRIFSVAYSPDGNRIAAGSSKGDSGILRLYSSAFNPALPDDLKPILEKTVDQQNPDEKKKVEAYVTADVAILHELPLPTTVYSVDWNVDGTALAVGGGDGLVRLIDPATGAITATFPAAPAETVALAARPLPELPVPLPPAEGTAPEPQPDPTRLKELSIEPADLNLHSVSTYAQVLVTATLDDGSRADVTRFVTWKNEAGLVAISPTGVIRPRKEGQGHLAASWGGKELPLPVTVSALNAPIQPDFIRDVNPVISKLGCNQGTCHGSKDGKNGFKLSLRGYDPIFDVTAFTDEHASRRVTTAAPDSSVMLLKASATVPHEGGQTAPLGSIQYEILRAWIENGSKLDLAAPKVTSMAIVPFNPVVGTVGAKQQIRVVATYSDGATRDVTAEAFVESGNIDVATADKAGLVTTLRRGEAPILVRYEGHYAATTVTVMGDRTGFAWQEPPAFNEIDKLAARKWERMKIQPSELCTDSEFIRRVHLDLTGLPPTPEVVTAFLADTRESRLKREEVIAGLIGNPAYIEHWSNKWADLLQVNSKFLGGEGAKAFRNWIRAEVEANTPWDKFSQKILTASGSNKENPAASYYKILRTPEDRMENTTHLFLATRFNCNKCHDHPFERWTQDQYYQTAAWFAQTSLEADPASGNQKIGGSAVEGATPLFEKVIDTGTGDMVHDRTKQIAAPQFPYPATFQPAEPTNRRQQLAAWITSADNRYFALSHVNRIWGYLTGTGLIEPLDDIRAGNPPSNPELLDYLTKFFIENGFDDRKLMAHICQSRVYQLSLQPNQWNEDDTVNFSHAKARRLPAETLFDAVMAVTGSTPDIPGAGAGVRAAALLDAQTDLPSGFLATLGRPVRESACECERSNDVQLGAVMSLLSGPVVSDAISDPKNAIATMVTAEPDDRKLVDQLFVRVLNRPATSAEIDAALQMVAEIDADHATLVAQLAEAEAKDVPLRLAKELERRRAIETARQALTQREAEVGGLLAEANKVREANIAAAKTGIETYEKDQLPAKMAAWEAPFTLEQLRQEWLPLAITKTEATEGSVLAVEADGAIFASGAQGKPDYIITAETKVPRITGVILEMLPDERLPNLGPGRSTNGNFVLQEFKAEWTALTDGNRKGNLKFNAAKATFEQANFPVTSLFDGKEDSANGWAMSESPRTRHFAVLSLETPLEEKEGVSLRIVLSQRYQDNLHQLGKFRLWVTDSATPLAAAMPESIASIVRDTPARRTAEQQQALISWFRDSDPELGALRLKLAAALVPVPPDQALDKHKAALALAEQPVAESPALLAIRRNVETSLQQMLHKRLTASQDLVWALINSPAFLFNH